MTESLVIMNNPIRHAPLIQLLLHEALSQTLQSVTVEHSTDDLTLGVKFSMHTAVDVKQNM